MLTDKAKKYLKRIAWYTELPEDVTLEQLLHREYERIRNRELRKCGKAQAKYHEEHPEEAELMMRIQGIIE